ncbi:hypothetical protein JX265_013312 [Neoarthrinium moseri]|uniref:Uncharacterized protein n=1 Tax=Neoarthrinium moseri TaxID=1658444 RepID=A0A9P9W8V4_9PEZI|nr:uncharacterized protein JN550_013352 [Neoarthrinium moseri]KAI1843430.1 hypothetical protein JX266_010427 [Neoarthrinium moseri]KAI1850832.1 hypothetical protein JX265_013312 [Neoarthrinium moseri]KAI1857269.1 hypothetical protein JN550_013352 [Neoarthrinium moseri]
MSPPSGEESRRRLPKSKTGCRRCKKRKIKVTSSFVSTQPPNTDRNKPLARNFWRINIPQMGFETNYILRGILSLSALHLARFRPERKDFYVAQAILHHNAALATASPLYPNINGENCVPLFLFSTINLFFVFAKPKDPTDFLLASNHAVPDWLYLFRGVRAVLHAEHDMLHASSISGMFETGVQTHRIWVAHTFENEAFRELEANIVACVPEDSPKLEALLDALLSLKRSFYLVYESGQTDENKARGVFIWLFAIKTEYIELVGDADSEALCILAFFCILLRRLDFNWWIEGWGLHLMGRIYAMLNVNYRLVKIRRSVELA